MDRFKALSDDKERSEFRDKLSGYVNVYAFLSQIMPYADPDLEMLYSFGRFLLPHLPVDRDDKTFENAAFSVLSKVIYESIPVAE